MKDRGVIAVAAIVCLWALGPLGCGSGVELPAAGPMAAEPVTPPTDSPASVPASVEPAPDSRSVDQKLSDLPPVVPRPGAILPTADRPARAAAELAEGRRLLAIFLPNEAIGHFERAHRFAPTDAVIRRDLGVALYQAGQTARAFEHLQAAHQAGGDDLETQVFLGRLYGAAGQRVAAMRAYRTALWCSDAAPHNPLAAEALARLAELLVDDRQYAAALDATDVLRAWSLRYGASYAAAEAMAALDVSARALVVRRARILIVMDRAAEAADLLRSAGGQTGLDPATGTVLLEALTAAGQLAEAERLGETLSSRGMAPPEAVVGGILAGHVRQGQWAEAIVWAAAFAGRHEPAAEACGEAVAALPVGQAPEGLARELAETFAEDHEAAWARHYVLARFAEAQGRWPLAADEYARSTASRAGFLPAYTALVTGWLARGRVDRAQSVAAQLQRDNPGSVLGHYLAGRIRLQTGATAEAMEPLLQAASMDPGHLPTQMLLAEAYIRQGQLDRAEMVLRSVQRQAPTWPGLLRKLLEVKKRQGYVDDMVNREIPRLLASHPGALEVRLVHVEALLLTAQLDEAARQASQLARAHPDSLDAQLLAIEAALSAAANKPLRLTRGPVASDPRISPRQFDGGAILMGRSPPEARPVAIAPGYEVNGALLEFPTEQIVGARLAALREAPPEALQMAMESCRDLARRWPGRPEPRQLLGDVLTALDRTTEALALWQELLAEFPANPDVLWGAAIALSQNDQTGTLIATMQRLAHAEPNSQRARQGLFVGLLRAQRYEELAALVGEWIDQGEQTGQDVGGLRERLALVQFLAGNYDACRAALGEIAGPKDRSTQERRLLRQVATFIAAGRYDDAVAVADAQTDGWARTSVQWGLIGALRVAKQYDRALAVLDDVLAGPYSGNEGDDGEELRVHILLAAGRADEAEAMLDARLSEKLRPGHRIYRQLMVRVLARSGRLDEAVAYVRREAHGAGDNPMRRELLWHLLAADRYEEMASQAGQWARQSPVVRSSEMGKRWRDWPPLLLLVKVLRDGRQWSSLEMYLDHWHDGLKPVIGDLAEAPPPATDDDAVETWRYVRSNIIQVLIHRQETSEAVRRGRAFLDDDPNSVSLLVMTAAALNEDGQTMPAVDLLKKAYGIVSEESYQIDSLPPAILDRQGNSYARYWRSMEQAHVFNSLGYSYADEGILLPDAEHMIRSSLEIRKRLRGQEPSHTLDSLGWVLYKQRRLPEAAETFVQVLATGRREATGEDPQPEQAVLYDHAGDVRYRMGDSAGAVRLWAKALRLAATAEPRRDNRRVQQTTPLKLRAISTGRVPPVAPLGKGVPDDLMRFQEERAAERLAPSAP